jgi:hypothetical protein
MAKMYSEIQLDLQTKGYIASIEKLKQQNSKLRDDHKKKISQMNKNNDSLISKFKKMAGVIGVAFGVQKVIAFAKEAVILAAKAEGITTAFNKLNSPDLLNNLREATRGTVADIDLMSAAVRANNFQISLEALPKYFAFAQQRARDTGESVDYLVDSIVRGIGTRSSKILDNLGISLTAINEELKVTPDYATAIGNIMTRELTKGGVAVETTMDSIEQLKASMTNLKVEAGDAFNDAFAKPLAEAAQSIADVISGISDLRKELDLGGVNKDLANQVRGNIAMAGGTAAGQFMSMLFGGRKAGKHEILIEAGTPIVKLKETKGAIEEVDEAAKRTSLDAEQMWKALLNPTAQPVLPMSAVTSTQRIQEGEGGPLTNRFGSSTLFADPEQLAKVREAMVAVNEEYRNHYELMYQLQGTFESLFSSGINGWDEFGKAAVDAIKQIVVRLASLAATYLVLSMIPGFAAFLEIMGRFSGFMTQGMGFSPGMNINPAAMVGSSGGNMILKGRDIVYASERSGSVIFKNT